MAADLANLADQTPESRDRFMDFLRGASIVAVVFGHWLISIIAWRGGIIHTTSAIGVTRGLWLATWVFQVMPIFFFVGGFSNLVAYESNVRRGGSTTSFIRSRLQRLLRPSIVFLGIWVLVQVILHLSDTGAPAGPSIGGGTKLLRGMYPPGSTLPFGPLWFLGVYMVVVSISPLTIRLHRRFRWWVPAVFVIGAFAADIVGFGTSLRAARYANVAFVLLFPHQLGHFYADGSFAKLSRRVYGAMVGIGLGLLVILTNPWFFRWVGGLRRFTWFPGIGYYPRSLLGTDVETISNAYPPTLCYLAVGIWTIGAVMLVRPRLTRWLQRRGPWKAVILANTVVMTLFLWHMTAFLLSVLLLWPLGLGRETSGTSRWWLERFAWIGVPAVILAVLVGIFARFERPARKAATAASQ
jgi:fucose 4-O-acetylase-like acetyltransferase